MSSLDALFELTNLRLKPLVLLGEGHQSDPGYLRNAELPRSVHHLRFNDFKLLVAHWKCPTAPAHRRGAPLLVAIPGFGRSRLAPYGAGAAPQSSKRSIDAHKRGVVFIND